MDGFDNDQAGNADGLEYDEEDEQIQVYNPNKIEHQTAKQVQKIKSEEEEDDNEPIVDTIPSFFSQRFASDLIGNGNQDSQDSNEENVNVNNIIFQKVAQHEANDCKLNINTIQMKQLLGQEKMAPDLLPYQHSLVEIISK